MFQIFVLVDFGKLAQKTLHLKTWHEYHMFALRSIVVADFDTNLANTVAAEDLAL